MPREVDTILLSYRLVLVSCSKLRIFLNKLLLFLIRIMREDECGSEKQGILLATVEEEGPGSNLPESLGCLGDQHHE